MTTVDSTGTVFFEQEGTLVHIPSGMQFPSRVGRFERMARPTVYDQAGNNVSVGYNRENWFFGTRKTSLTVYVYPGTLIADAPEGLLAAEFQRVKADLLRLHPDATLVTESDSIIADPEDVVAGRRATFLIPVASDKVTSEVHLFRSGAWLLKYRITYPWSQQSVTDNGVNAVLKILGRPRGT